MSKIQKQAVLYIHKAATQYTCGDCVFFKAKKCALYGPRVEIQAFGSCGFFIQRQNTVSIPWIGGMTKNESGYTENESGFSCKRCEEFILSGDCKKVDKDSPGNDPGEISKNACCNRWSPDEKRAPMSTPDLIKYISENASTPEAMPAAAAVAGQVAPADPGWEHPLAQDSLHR